MSEPLEKLERSVSKIHQRINEIEVEAARKEGSLEATLTSIVSSIEDIKNECSRTNEALFGDNGHKGIFVRIDRLEQSEQRQTWRNRTFWLGFVALIANLLFSAFTTHLQPKKADPPEIKVEDINP